MCIFCKIINQEIPAYVIYEDDLALAFLDISQVTKGHTLVIPKVHTEDFLSCDPEVISHLFKVSQSLGNHLKTTLNARGLNMLSNVGEVAGQTVMHFHIHLIPRYHDDDDGLLLEFKPDQTIDLAHVHDLLRQ